MLKITVIQALILASFVCHGQDSIEFAEVYYKDAWRIIDRNGNFILEQEYGVGMYQNLCFEEKLAMSIKGDKVGFIDFNGNEIIPNKFDAAYCFAFGYAPVAVGSNLGNHRPKGRVYS